MERHGFIHDIFDVKVLILFVMNKVLYPVDEKKLYELCYWDDCLSYCDFCTAVPELVSSGHLEQTAEGLVITDRGRENCAVTADTVAYPVAQKAERAVEQFNRQIRRESFIHTEILPRQTGDYSVVMCLDDEKGNLMTLELMAPTPQQARAFSGVFRGSADVIYQQIMRTMTATERERPKEAPDADSETPPVSPDGM